MSQILQLIQQQNNRIAALQALIEGSISRGLLYAVAGDHIVYGCRITQGASAADMYLALDGQAVGDSAHLNPDIQTPAMRIEEYPNLAMVYGRAFAVENINTATTDNDALLVADAPGTAGHGRYDIVYIYVNATGPAIGIATGTASDAITDLSADAYPVAGDPALVHGCFPIARVYVESGATGIADADIADLRDFTGRLKGEPGFTPTKGVDYFDGVDGHSPVLTWTGDQIAIDGVAEGPHLTGPKGDTGMGFLIAKTYASVAALEADTEPTGIVNGQFAIIETGDVDDPENARLYLWNDGYTYVTDLSGTVGITGNGIASITLLSGDHSPGSTDTYRITFTNASTFNFTVYNGTNGTGSGDVVGPESSVEDDIAVFSGLTGKLVKGGGKKVADFALAGQSFFIGSTSVAINRASGALALTGITSIDGYAGGLAGGNSTTLLGSLPYQSNTNTTSLLGPNTTTIKKFLSMTGTGTNGAAPAWAALVDADIPSTLTGKHITKRVTSTTSSSTPAPDADTSDMYVLTALAAAATFAAPSGTPTHGQQLLIRIRDNGTARALAWNAIYRASSDLALPASTIINKTLYIGFQYNATDSKWDLLAVLNNF